MRAHLEGPVDHELIREDQRRSDAAYEFRFDDDVSDVEVTAMLASIEGELDEENREALLRACRDSVFESIIKPFGLARVLFNDKDGGNVTTQANAEKGTFANAEDEARFERSYDKEQYHNKNEAYVAARDRFGEAAKSGGLRDIYNSKRDVSRDFDTEHVVSAKEIHDKPGVRLFMTEEQSAGIANADANLGATDPGANRSKQGTAATVWADAPAARDPERTNAQVRGVDRDDLRRTDDKARAHIDREVNAAAVKHYATGAVKTGVEEGTKMGLQQALGLVLFEFASASWDEMRDVMRAGWKGATPDASFFEVLKTRLARVASRVASRWQDALKAFGGGFLAGFLANLVTMIINMFVRTGKRVVRIIREGVFSLLRALKMLISPPDGMTKREAAHEASKLIGAGLAIGAGVLLEEAIDKAIKAVFWLEPFADILTGVLVGMATGLAIVLIGWTVDRLDLLGMKKAERGAGIDARLEADLEKLFEEGEATVARMTGEPVASHST